MRKSWPLWLLSAVLLVGCGVPISASEITATAQSQQQSEARVSSSSLSVQSASRSDDASFANTRVASGETPTPLSTRELVEGATPEAAVTPTPDDPEADDADDEDEATATAEASETPKATPSRTPTKTPTAQPTAETLALSSSGVDKASEALSLLNQVRAENGLAPLNVDASLNAAAATYARYMAENNYFGHTGADGSTADSRIAAAGYPGVCMGEAISAGQSTAQEAITAWLNSAQHRAILLESRAEDVGIGYFYVGSSYYKHYWVLDTGVAAGWGCGG